MFAQHKGLLDGSKLKLQPLQKGRFAAPGQADENVAHPAFHLGQALDPLVCFLRCWRVSAIACGLTCEDLSRQS